MKLVKQNSEKSGGHEQTLHFSRAKKGKHAVEKMERKIIIEDQRLEGLFLPDRANFSII